MNYVVYHLHSDYSLLDSCTDYKIYIDRAVELGMKSIAFTEHGKPSGWVKKKMYCQEKGIKYLHGVECYLIRSLSEKVRDNYHTVLIAKNYDGFLEINQLISRSYDNDHFYYVNRLTFDEFLDISDNVIKISACLASPLNKLDINDPYYERLLKHYDYLEIQPHNHPDQIRFNRHLAIMSEKYHKPLIAGTDTHSLDQYKAECRRILLKAKGKSYGDEDEFDLTFKSYDELVDDFKKQDAIPESIYLKAIDNTNKMSDIVEDFDLDTSFKYPILYGTREEDYNKFINTIEVKFQDKIKNGVIPDEQIESFKSAINEELRVFKKIEMCGFMLSMSEIISWCKEHNIPIGPARGSVGGSRIAYITDITDLNPETWHTVFSRFCNEDRKEIGDIDVDLIESDRPKVFEYITNRFGCEYTARVPTFSTVADKGTIDEICRALSRYWKESHEDDYNDSLNPFNLKNTENIKKEYSLNPQAAIKKYPEVFQYFDGLVGTRVAQSIHSAGIVISPITLRDHYGTFIRNDIEYLMIDMDEIHEVSLVKYDLLVLNNIKIINDTCNLAGISYPKSHEMNWDDQEVWSDMLRSPIGIFQFEGDFAFSLLRQYQPHSIFDMSLVIAAIRPSGASYRDNLIKKIPNKNPSPIIDELLKDNNGYLIYQEDTIRFLQEVCGLSGSEADNIRRAIGRKDEERLKKALPQILDGYCKKSNHPRDIAEEEAKSFIRIIEDSASYQFGFNHSIAYCLVGYICAWLRKYYPYEFVTAYLNNAANDDDIKNGTKLAQIYGLKIIAPKFGISRSNYMFDKESKQIAKGTASIKFLNTSVSEQLYDLSSRRDYKNFIDLLYDIHNETSLNSRQLDILIKIDYFSMIGNSKELLKINEVFEFFNCGEAKSIKKDKVSNDKTLCNIIKKYSTDKTKSGKESKNYTIIDMKSLLYECESYIKNTQIKDFDIKNKIAFQNEFLGYVSIQTDKEEDRKKLIIMDIFPLINKSTQEQFGYRLITRSIGSGKQSQLTVYNRTYKKNPILKSDIITADSINKNKRGYWELISYQKIC